MNFFRPQAIDKCKVQVYIDTASQTLSNVNVFELTIQETVKGLKIKCNGLLSTTKNLSVTPKFGIIYISDDDLKYNNAISIWITSFTLKKQNEYYLVNFEATDLNSAFLTNLYKNEYYDDPLNSTESYFEEAEAKIQFFKFLKFQISPRAKAKYDEFRLNRKFLCPSSWPFSKFLETTFQKMGLISFWSLESINTLQISEIGSNLSEPEIPTFRIYLNTQRDPNAILDYSNNSIQHIIPKVTHYFVEKDSAEPLNLKITTTSFEALDGLGDQHISKFSKLDASTEFNSLRNNDMTIVIHKNWAIKCGSAIKLVMTGSEKFNGTFMVIEKMTSFFNQGCFVKLTLTKFEDIQFSAS